MKKILFIPIINVLVTIGEGNGLFERLVIFVVNAIFLMTVFYLAI